MLTAISEGWSIVILGRWNVNIFSPDWLAENIFDGSTEGLLEFPMVPGQPFRVTSKDVQLIPSIDKLQLKATKLDDDTLKRMEDIACKLLTILSHTPIQATGINFLFECRGEKARSQLLKHFPIEDEDQFSERQLRFRHREMTRSLEYDDRTLNLKTAVLAEVVRFEFNFHRATLGTKEAVRMVDDSILKLRDVARKVLHEIYGLKEEAE